MKQGAINRDRIRRLLYFCRDRERLLSFIDHSRNG
jgi:hypothetical protein